MSCQIWTTLDAVCTQRLIFITVVQVSTSRIIRSRIARYQPSRLRSPQFIDKNPLIRQSSRMWRRCDVRSIWFCLVQARWCFLTTFVVAPIQDIFTIVFLVWASTLESWWTEKFLCQSLQCHQRYFNQMCHSRSNHSGSWCQPLKEGPNQSWIHTWCHLRNFVGLFWGYCFHYWCC